MDNVLVELLNKGGVLMWPLLFCSVLAIAVIVERSVFFLRIARNYRRFVAELVPMVARRRFEIAQQYLRPRPDPASVVALTYLSNMDLEPKLREEVIQRAGNQQIERIESRLGVLGGVAHLSPLLGLFGTVLGMIEAFRRVEELGAQADVSALAGGIWEALLTTAFGLAIAIPAAAAHQYFEGLARSQMNRMSDIVSVLNEALGVEPVKVEFASKDLTSGETEDAAV